jgi:ArsR family transcriptional regulator
MPASPTPPFPLRKLKQAGLLPSDRRGTWVYCRVETTASAAMGKLLALPAAA